MKRLNGNTGLIITIMAAAISYGILVGQVRSMDQRLARVEAVLLGNALPTHSPLIPPASAGERTAR